MASITSISKAQGIGFALQQITGQEPSYAYEPDYVRVYFEPDRLQLVQKKLEQMASSGPGDVRIDWMPIVLPYAVKKAALPVIGVALAGFILGKML